MNAMIEIREQLINQLSPHAGKAFQQGIGSQKQHGPRYRFRKRITDAARVRKNQIQLQIRGVFFLNQHIAELAEPRRNPVNGLLFLNDPFNRRPAFFTRSMLSADA